MPAQPGIASAGEEGKFLSDRVTVERIGALDPREQFKKTSTENSGMIRPLKTRMVVGPEKGIS
jgi:hypothetical protein